ncbi:MAG: indole-3-glycerol-phosphate synthase TrpC, partial [Acidobacteriota bacterium]
MQQTVPDILARIVEVKRRELRERTAEPRLAERAADGMATRRDFRAALEGSTPAVIAEIKKGSPSKGIFTESFDPAALATSYEAGGAAALSVLTDRQFFYGS